MSQPTTKLNDQLRQHGLRGTAARRDVLSIFQANNQRALSSADVEENLSSIDRITLYRTLKSFEEAGLIHQVADGTGKVKFALCGHRCDEHDHHDTHAHFRCVVCGTTACLHAVTIPEIRLPKDYQMNDAQLVLTGVCANCQS
ncbi:Fur family transcriptional regulator [Lewinella sp. W8]|uniref:Fur family transcriptional regulator n=1 Tax=Lewinella sp. W8 TaxID=2528208 RepID=UPI0010682140|nr:transcriptional repressor [Lewinella sp. W8]MTB50477.1 transcriptional repressor [Lewinella sp. W8]